MPYLPSASFRFRRLSGRLFALWFLAALGLGLGADWSAAERIGPAGQGASLRDFLRSRPDIPRLAWTVVRAYPHDPGAFTEGLVYHDGFLYESTGLYGQSSLRRVALDSGAVLDIRPAPPELFCEGLALLGDRLYQLTWKSRTILVYDRASLALAGAHPYGFEGWGLTTDGRRLIASDGTDRLRFIAPDNFAQTASVAVSAGGRPVARLNELEYVQGRVYANVWLEPVIVVVDPSTGRVEAWLDLSDLARPFAGDPEAVANGIAYDAGGNRLFVTGKRWTRLYELRLGE